ncbi:hypothetical protein RO3G_09556 [Lichtheimia corymbifera JMRC:FSU:9682]|uniref:25S rRNA (uridine-N(3))-methyltransferase BMT5-like domain-containing protein n=1 Tax=Lichtheimia corymbifera JMRC:FSU:9682 TaxID=1263082 RepID=A0A068RR22_9FUNG|nr:hypothetical protein RO3G_09556 [Lichtheimia corymbifera JMRC:FSU:9682]
MGPPKKKKLVQSLNKTLRKVEKCNIQKAKQERREQQLAKTNKQKVYERKPTFDENDRILLIGEGNFSFARAIADHYMQRNPALITATCLDSESVLYEKYGDEAKDNIEALQDLGVTVLFEVDGTQLGKHKLIRKNRYTKIIFNFPHAGAGIKDQDHNVRANQALLNDFFASATPFLSIQGEKRRHRSGNSNVLDMEPENEEEGGELATASDEPLPDGEIHVTIKTCKPYNLWDVKRLAKTTGALAVKATLPFNPTFYPGYEHRRTLGFKEGVSQGNNAEILKSDPKTFVIVRKDAMAQEFERSKQGAINKKKELQRQALLSKRKRKQRPRNQDDDDDDDDDDHDD